MKKPKPLSKQMAKCLKALTVHRVLVRHGIGFWSAENVEMIPRTDPMDGNIPLWWYEWGTIKALCARGLAEVTEERQGRYGKYSVRVQIKNAPMLKKINSYRDLDPRSINAIVATAVKPRAAFDVGATALVTYQYFGENGRNGYRLAYDNGHVSNIYSSLPVLLDVEINLGDLEFYEIKF